MPTDEHERIPQGPSPSRRTRGAHITAWGAAALVTLAATRVGAQPATPAPLQVSWHDDGLCPDDGSVLSEARQLAGPEGERSDLRTFAVDLSRDTGGGLHVRLRADGGERQVRREFVQPTCEQARRATALLIALSLNPDAVVAAAPEATGGEAGADGGEGSGAADTPAEEPPGPDTRPPPADPPPPAAQPAIPPAATTDARADRADAVDTGVTGELRWELGATASLAASTLPTTAPAFGVVGALRWGGATRLRAELLIDYAPPIGSGVEAGAGEVELRLLRAVLTGCTGSALTDLLEVGPCAGIAGGWLDGESLGVARPGGDGALWLAPEVGAAVGLELDAVIVRARVAASLPLRRARVAVEGVGDVFTVPAVGLWAGLSVRVPL